VPEDDSAVDGKPEITCLIVDDHEVVREGLRLSLSRAPHIRVIGEAADGPSGGSPMS
jgi:DNA-binding NarL/FixJ family response regulator